MDLLVVADTTAEVKDLAKELNGLTNARVDTLWVFMAGVLVMFMQAGFLLLEVGFSRMKNVGTVAAKVIANLSIAALAYWAVGFALAFGGSGSPDAATTGWFAGTDGFFLHHTAEIAAPALSFSDATIGSKFFFQFAFAAVSLAIVWGTTLERIKFGAYLIYAVIFAAVIYPLASHWIFGGGWLQANFGMQDFAGSTVIHLVGATGALAALLLLGPRQGKYGPDGRPNVIPGHSMPLVGLGVIILWFGWFGFNPGSTLSTLDGRFAEVAIVTWLGGAAGVLGAMATIWIVTRSFDIGMTLNGAIAGLVGITAPSGYVELWFAPVIGVIAGIIVVVGVILIDKVLDDPVGALSAHGLAGIWGTLACGLFTAPRLAEYNGIGATGADGEFLGGLVYSGSFEQLGVQALGVVAAFASVFAISFLIFFAIKAVYGLRVKPEEERYGLDIVEHGMWGYPEQFMPVPGYEYHQPSPPAGRPAARPAPVGLGGPGAAEGRP
ncbi:MAG: ammonium transporter [Solirubrobacterales bacterium]